MISIIVPVYQCKENIKMIVQDILQQTYQDYELILVDDGSDDGSIEICQEYAATNKNIRVILKEHNGVGSTRNVGIQAAEGEYIAFIDSDDRIQSDYLENLFTSIEGFDLIISTFAREFYKDGVCIKKESVYTDENEISLLDAWDEMFSQLYIKTLIGVVYCKLYKRDILVNNQILFREDISLGEDFLFNFEYLKQCKNIKCIKEQGYRYICHIDKVSLTRTKNLKNIEYGKILFEESIAFCDTMNLGDEAKSAVSNLYLRTCIKNIENISMMRGELENKNKEEIIKEIISDDLTKSAVCMANPNSIEFFLYRVILKMKLRGIIKGFVWMRLQYKKITKRA